MVGEDGEQAVAHIKSRPADFYMAILDVVMPKMGGLEVVEHFKQHHCDLKVLLISGYSPELALTGAGDSPPLLKKPFRSGELLRQVRTILDD